MQPAGKLQFVTPDKQKTLFNQGPFEERLAHAQRFIDKASQDPIYASALPYLDGQDKIQTANALYDAGFFDDGAPSISQASQARLPDQWLMTPLHKIINRSINKDLTNQKRMAVLLTTGGFAPVHYGHLEMMEIARRTLEHEGVLVLGGYLSPGHDDYVQPKCQGLALDALHRLRLCQEAVSESNWLMACGWEALGTERMVNFTDVIIRLQSYLKTHLPFSDKVKDKLEVTYVFGSDNARFASTFVAGHSCVCVLRPEAESAFEKFSQDPLLKRNTRIVFAGRASHNVSSKNIRVKDQSLSHAVPPSYWQWTQQLEANSSDIAKASYYIRNEGNWCIKDWIKTPDMIPAYNQSLEQFRADLVKLFIDSHQKSRPPDKSYAVTVEYLALADQIHAAAMLARGHSVISLDPCIAGDYDLKVSRCFPLSAPLTEAEMVARPGSNELPEQIQAIPEGAHILFDDDIFSGSTVQRVQELLPAPISIRAVCALTIRGKNQQSTLLDILDSRDFLAGSHEGGLVLELPDGTLGRAPYCLPYVSPCERASIPLSQEIDFSKQLWLLNERFFAALPDCIRLNQANPAFIRLMQLAGFDSNATMVQICKWHQQQLQKMPQSSKQ
ncbi:MAG: hypothetical protein IPJ49_19460 [Candidatus Obscuribacter sp.]|nr:hypothetical protein [Candidatus Obscuribacter sp.]